MPTLTGDSESPSRIVERKGISSWFSGSSAPIAVGIPVSEQEVSSTVMVGSRESQARRQTTWSTPDTSGTRFSFFGTRPPPPPELPASIKDDDELLTLDISSALFPDGDVASKDPFSPAAFKNLLQNAEGLLAKLHDAYKHRTLSLHELEAEKEAQKDELDEAETRAAHLKIQLRDMAQRVAQQDSVAEELRRELAAERAARAQEREAQQESIKLIKHRRIASQKLCPSLTTDGHVDMEEDLGISTARPHTWRYSKDSRSAGTTSSRTDSDDETDSPDSLFSRSRSPVLDSSATSILTVESTTLDTSTCRPRGETSQPTLPASRKRDSDAQMAWDTVTLLTAENRSLKDKVQELEGGVDGALDALIRMGLS